MSGLLLDVWGSVLGRDRRLRACRSAISGESAATQCRSARAVPTGKSGADGQQRLIEANPPDLDERLST
jgi:hypothetical protein